MINGATRLEKRTNSHKRKRKILGTISILVMLCTSILISGGAKYESKAADGDEVITFDSKSAGITLNLFDYYGDTKDGYDLDTYNNSPADNTISHPVLHGINTGKDVAQDLLFLANATYNGQNDNIRKLNAFTGSTTPRQGLVENKLNDAKYPQLKIGRKSSLQYLFDPDDNVTPGKDIYENVNHLFKQSANGYFEFDSTKEYAYYDVSSANQNKDFKVYKNAQSKGFFPFNTYSYSQNHPSVSPCNYNHHLGMTMEFQFKRTVNGTLDGTEIGDPLIFEFTGDDDVWVFIDGVLVLDIGGIHRESTGTINFKNGNVSVTGYPDTTLSALFTNASMTFNNDPEVEHTLKFFFLERGSTYSNCSIKCNLPTGLHISKTVAEKHEGTTTNIKADTSYKFQLFVDDGTGSKPYGGQNKQAFINNDRTKPVVFEGSPGDYYFTMTDGQTIDIYDIYPWQDYYLKEFDINEKNITGVKMGDTLLGKLDNKNGVYSVKSDVAKLYARTSIAFTNYPKEYIGVKVEKYWFKPDGSTPKTDVPDSITVQLKREVKDSEGNITEQADVGQEVIIYGPKNNGTWSHDWGNQLDAFNHDNKPYYYYVTELKVGDKTLAASEYTVRYGNNYIFYGSSEKEIKVDDICKFIENITFPETGGRGTTAFTVTGIALLLLSGSLYLLAVRKKRRCM